MDEQHPALRLNSDPAVIAEAIRQALASVVGLEPIAHPPAELDVGPEPSWAPIEPVPEMVEASQLTTESPG
jgi:hypothetical protein